MPFDILFIINNKIFWNLQERINRAATHTFAYMLTAELIFNIRFTYEKMSYVVDLGKSNVARSDTLNWMLLPQPKIPNTTDIHSFCKQVELQKKFESTNIWWLWLKEEKRTCKNVNVCDAYSIHESHLVAFRYRIKNNSCPFKVGKNVFFNQTDWLTAHTTYTHSHITHLHVKVGKNW